MLTALIVLGLLGAVVFVVLGVIGFIKKKSNAKKMLIGAAACFVVMVVSAANAPQAQPAPGSSPSAEQSSVPSLSPAQNQTAQAAEQQETAATAPAASSTPDPATVKADNADDNRIAAKIVKVVDGDTMNILIGDKKETVRLLLVDTPETVHPDKPVQPFGPEASKFAHDTLDGKDITIEKDLSERDKYGRLLCYLWIGDKMFNEMLLEQGLARVAYVYAPNVKYVDRFRDIQKSAQLSAAGIWSIENYATEDGFNDQASVNSPSNPKATAKPATSAAPATAKPASGSEASMYYKNCKAAKAAGAAPINRGEPGYRAALDGDGDGVACEK